MVVAPPLNCFDVRKKLLTLGSLNLLFATHSECTNNASLQTVMIIYIISLIVLVSYKNKKFML